MRIENERIPKGRIRYKRRETEAILHVVTRAPRNVLGIPDIGKLAFMRRVTQLERGNISGTIQRVSAASINF